MFRYEMTTGTSVNRENTRQAIEVMQAYADGSEIQQKRRESESGWYQPGRPVWDWDRFNYRVKPAPREFWCEGGSDD